MHTVELLERALETAGRLGYRVRQDWLGGAGGASCELKGQKYIFLDVAQTPAEQLATVAEALRDDPRLAGLEVAPPLRGYIETRRAA